MTRTMSSMHRSTPVWSTLLATSREQSDAPAREARGVSGRSPDGSAGWVSLKGTAAGEARVAARREAAVQPFAYLRGHEFNGKHRSGPLSPARERLGG
jgi:hypothetical protein